MCTKSVWTDSWRGWLGLSLDGIDVFRGVPFPLTADIPGSGGRPSRGDIRPPTRDGRRPGCDEERLLPPSEGVVVPDSVPPGRDDATAFEGIEPMDAVESAGDAARDVGGAEVFVLR